MTMYSCHMFLCCANMIQGSAKLFRYHVLTTCITGSFMFLFQEKLLRKLDKYDLSEPVICKEHEVC